MRELITKVKTFIKTYLNPIIIIGLSILGFLNMGVFGFKANAKIYFLIIAFIYAVFYIDGFWDIVKKGAMYLYNKAIEKWEKVTTGK